MRCRTRTYASAMYDGSYLTITCGPLVLLRHNHPAVFRNSFIVYSLLHRTCRSCHCLMFVGVDSYPVCLVHDHVVWYFPNHMNFARARAGGCQWERHKPGSSSRQLRKTKMKAPKNMRQASGNRSHEHPTFCHQNSLPMADWRTTRI